MSATFAESAERYLCFRRNLGFAIAIEGEQLLRFARYADSSGHTGPLTIELAVQWATQSMKGNHLNHARRLNIVRRFARFLHLTVPSTEIPPEGILGPSYRRMVPHIYIQEEIADLISASRNLTPRDGLRPNTYATLFGLLTCTGMRISEALNLSVDHFDNKRNLIVIVEGKFHKTRLLPLHPSTTEMLRTYSELRYHKHSNPKTKHFFLTEWGTSLKYPKVLKTFHSIAATLGWKTGGIGEGPRIHDLRHTFAVNSLLQWYRNGEDIDCRIPELSTYLGHCKVAHTYWYLTAVPELMAIAAARFEQHACMQVNYD